MLKVLIIKPSSLGDIVHAAPAVEMLAAIHPDVKTSWLVNEEYAHFVEKLPGVAEAIPFPRRRLRLRTFPRWVPDVLAWSRSLNRGFRIAVDFQGLQRSGIMASLSRAEERFGFHDAREMAWLHYNERVHVPKAVIHAAERCLALAEEVARRSRLLREARGGTSAPRASDRFGEAWTMSVPPEEKAAGDAAIGADPRRPVALCPGARWASKRWPADRWARLVEAVADEPLGLRPVIVGGPSEREQIDEIRALLPDPPAAFSASSVWHLAGALSRCVAAVTLDSASLHLAASLGVPTVSLFGPTDPQRVGPRGPSHRILMDTSLQCLRCYERACPLAERLCLPRMTVEQVLAALKEVLLERKEAARSAVAPAHLSS